MAKRIFIPRFKRKGLPLEEALRRAQEMGIALDNQNLPAKSNEVYNFGIYRYQNNNKCSKYILQLNFRENNLYLIKRGVRQRSYQFDSIKNIDTTDDSPRIIVQFENGSYIEVESRSLEEKNQLSHLLFSILNQDRHNLPILNSFVTKRESIILEGILEKKGHNAAFLKWTKRYVKVLPGEIMYFKVGDQENESTALNIIPLTVDVVLKKGFDSGFTLLLKDKEYSFRIIPSKNNDVELERDSWLIAIERALSITSKQDCIDGIDQKQLYINAVSSIKLQLKQFESVLHTIAPFQASEILKKIENTIFLFSEQIKSKLFTNIDTYNASNNQMERTAENIVLLKNISTPLNTADELSLTTKPPHDESSIATLNVKDQSFYIPTAPPSNLQCNILNDPNFNILIAPRVPPPPSLEFRLNPLINESNASNLSNSISPLFTAPSPPLFGISPKLPLKSNEAPTCKIKPLFWNKIPDLQIMNSFWMNSPDRTNLLNVKKLENLFYQVGQENTKNDPKNSKRISELDCKNNQNVTLLDQRKAQNLGIFLSGFKINETNIEQKLLSTNEGLTSEEIVALKRFLPTADEIEMYKHYQGDNKKLTEIDKFMIKLCNISNLGKRLDVLLTMHDLPDEIKNIKIPLKHLTNASLCLLENNDFTRLLEYILSLGNYINGGTSRGAAHGFKLSVLTKLVDIRSNDKKYTLLDFIVEELLEVDKDAICCYKYMQPLKGPIDFSFKNLMTEFQVMKKELQSLKDKHQVIEADLGEKLCKSFLEFYDSCSKKLSKIEVMCQNVQNLYASLIKKFGESSALNIETWLGETGCFIKHLQIAVENAEKKNKDNVTSLTNLSISALVGTNANKGLVFIESNKLLPNSQLKTSSIGEQLKRVDNNESVQTASLDIKKTAIQNEDKLNIYEKQSFNQIKCLEETEQLNKVMISGLLEKLSGGKKRTAKWDHRYFELTENGYLQYFKKKGGTIMGNICIKGCPISLDPKDNCIINILQNNREWKFKAENNIMTAEWFNSLLHHTRK